MNNHGNIGFEIGKVYNRRKEIHSRFGGQQQGGICTPKSVPAIFLFTGEGGEGFGYKDQWDENGIFNLFGEGQSGNMSFQRGNGAIRDHLREGKDLYLFQALGKSKGVRFLGLFLCAGYHVEKGLDKDGLERDAIVFHLAPIDATGSGELSEGGPEVEDIGELRKRAYEASKVGNEITTKDSIVSLKLRSKTVSAYVLRRANGVCECCKKDAPFNRKKNGQPYLEPHHTHRLADGGPDDPKWVGAICPNCHREIHSGIDGDELNAKLKHYLEQVEGFCSIEMNMGNG